MKTFPNLLRHTNDFYNQSRVFLTNFDEYLFSTRANLDNDPLEQNMKLLHSKCFDLKCSIQTSYGQLLKGFRPQDITKNQKAETTVSANILTAPFLYLLEIAYEIQRMERSYTNGLATNRMDDFIGRISEGLKSLEEINLWIKELIDLMISKLELDPDKKPFFEKDIRNALKKVDILTKQS